MKRLYTLFCILILLFPISATAQNEIWEVLHERALDAYRAGYFEEALANIVKGKAQAEKEFGKQNEDYLKALMELGQLAEAMEYYDKAEAFYKEAADLSEAVYKVSKYKSEYIIYLAEHYELTSQYEKAEPIYKQCILVLNSVKNEQYIFCVKHLGDVYYNTFKDAQAETLYKEAVDLYLKTFGEKDYTYADAMNCLAVLYTDMKQYSKAEPLYVKCLAIYKKIYNTKHPDYINTLNNLASLYEQTKNYEKAEDMYKQCLAVYEANFDLSHPDYVVALNNLARLYEDMGDLDAAELYYLKVIPIQLEQIAISFPVMSEKEKATFWNNYKENFERFNSFVINRRRDNPAIVGLMYDNQLATKALLLNSSAKIRHRILTGNDKELKDSFVKWQTLKDSLARSYTVDNTDATVPKANTKDLESQVNVLEKELSLHSEIFARSRDYIQAGWKDIKNELDDEEAAVEIIRFRKYDKGWTDSIYYAALIITGKCKQPELVLLKNGIELEGKYLKYYQNGIKLKKNDTYSYKEYWKPIYQKLLTMQASTTKIYLAPDGVYNQVNINSLYNLANNNYVLQETEIHLLTNTKEIFNFSRKGNPKYTAVLVGNPLFTLDAAQYKTLVTPTVNNSIANPEYHEHLAMIRNITFTPLPGTENEVINVQSLLQSGKWKTTLYTKQYALEETIKNIDNPKILHIATHGFFVESSPNNIHQSTATDLYSNPDPMLRSGLVLAGVNTDKGGDSEDGVLTALEATMLNLDNTDLVVLSACETGLGDIQCGEGVFGLQRAFKVAGAKSILISLWTVDDLVTQELMKNFYQKLLETGDLRASFIFAQQLIKDKYKHPYYWGAFVLIGE